MGIEFITNGYNAVKDFAGGEKGGAFIKEGDKLLKVVGNVFTGVKDIGQGVAELNTLRVTKGGVEVFTGLVTGVATVLGTPAAGAWVGNQMITYQDEILEGAVRFTNGLRMIKDDPEAIVLLDK